MLRLLLDEHISPKVAAGITLQQPDIVVAALVHWHEGRYLGMQDEAVLAAAVEQAWTLVTYDLRTIAPLLKDWGEMGRVHGGVIFVDERTLAPNDFGGLARALGQLWTQQGSHEWSNRVIFLTTELSAGNAPPR